MSDYELGLAFLKRLDDSETDSHGAADALFVHLEMQVPAAENERGLVEALGRVVREIATQEST